MGFKRLGFLAAVVLCTALIVKVYLPNYSTFILYAAKVTTSAIPGFSKLFVGDHREKDCLQYVRTHARKGDPKSVMNAIDKFGWTEQWMMNIGDTKGDILSAEIIKKSPKNVLEVGVYVGYSSVRIGSDLTPDSHLTSIELSAFHANIAREMIEYAGLTDLVDVVEGTVTTALQEHMRLKGITQFDFVFLDHAKEHYLSDLKYLLQNNMIAVGGVIVADNVVFPGAPDFHKFVLHSPRFSTTEYETHVEYLPGITDLVTVSTLLS